MWRQSNPLVVRCQGMPVRALVGRHIFHFGGFAAVARLRSSHLHAVVNYRAVRAGGHDAIEINRDAARKNKTSFFYGLFTPSLLHAASINTANPTGRGGLFGLFFFLFSPFSP